MARAVITSWRRAAASLTVAGLILAGCAEPEPYYPAYQAYPGPGGAQQPPAIQPNGGWPSAPQEESQPELPSAPAQDSQPWTEPPLSNPSPSPNGMPGATPAAGTPAAGAAGQSGNPTDTRFNALKNGLEQPAAPSAAASVADSQPASPTGCTNVHQRAGFHDHYGGLNSAGDVLQTCPKPIAH